MDLRDLEVGCFESGDGIGGVGLVLRFGGVVVSDLGKMESVLRWRGAQLDVVTDEGCHGVRGWGHCCGSAVRREKAWR